jgi:hypothetical protein
MNLRSLPIVLVTLTLFSGLFALLSLEGFAGDDTEAVESPRPTVEEARGRASLLHDILHVTLQEVHREYYREDEGLTIPSATLDKVFAEVAKSHKVEFRWLAVNARPMSVDHSPRTDFEKQSVAALAGGEASYEAVEPGTYRRAGAIVLAAQCLKCHLPKRTSTEDRTAALVISMPVR